MQFDTQQIFQLLLLIGGLVGVYVAISGRVTRLEEAKDRDKDRDNERYQMFVNSFNEQKVINKDLTIAIQKNTEALIELKANFPKYGHA